MTSIDISNEYDLLDIYQYTLIYRYLFDHIHIHLISLNNLIHIKFTLIRHKAKTEDTTVERL